MVRRKTTRVAFESAAPEQPNVEWNSGLNLEALGVAQGWGNRVDSRKRALVESRGEEGMGEWSQTVHPNCEVI